ncbi:MAG: YggS family pyridoxal phosphate-dependent enzyme [Steroidobacteraceae bacterium]
MLSNPQNSSLGVNPQALLSSVRQRIAQAASQAGRDVRSITLLAVTKGQDAARIRTAVALGLHEFGENYVGEALPKIRALHDVPAIWHFIGRLQANKTRAVAENFAWAHSVDRLRLAERLDAQRPPTAPALNVCVQVHIANDPQKGGVAPDEALPLMQAISRLPRLQLRGLMCMLPYDLDANGQHAAFARLRDLLETARHAGLSVDTLSMGMSGDMDAAIAEGATIVRVGTALFGPRAP